MKKILTIFIIYKDDKILLGMKKRGFGVGRWNGFGGKVEEGESIEEAAKREVLEESGLIIKDFKKSGVINFEFQDGTRSVEVHVFRSNDFEGRITESEEMRPEWFAIDNLPIDDMWPADQYWLPFVLADKKFIGKFVYDHPSTSDISVQSIIIEKEIKEIQDI